MIEKFYVGISLGFNSSASVVSNIRGLLFAISQERITGEKNTKEIPFDALYSCIGYMASNGVEVVEKVCVSHYQEFSINELMGKYKNKKFGQFCDYFCDRPMTAKVGPYEVFASFIECNGIAVKHGVVRVDHHLAHQFSNFGFYSANKFRNALHVSSDGFGDGCSSRASVVRKTCETCDLETIDEKKLGESIALIYQFTTGALGFKEHQHEGKITGLAAYGSPNYVEMFESIYGRIADHKFHNPQVAEKMIEESTIEDFDVFLKMKEITYETVAQMISVGVSREDVAASVQRFAELKIIEFITDVFNKLGEPEKTRDIFLSGGLFANVKINQRIRETGMFREVFVSPPMGDEGTAVGAAFAVSGAINNIRYDMFTGSNKACVGTIPDGDFEGSLDEPQVLAIANLLANKKIVCFVHGRLEFGPRALCRRSILYDCSDYDTNRWLNEKLSRTEFMPFAPVCMVDDAASLFEGISDSMEAAKYMTMTFNCTDEMAKDYKAACHVDFTARPQIVNPTDDYDMYRILMAYRCMTGKKALINTSFNLHNNPIIESTEEAIRSWSISGTDALVIGDRVFLKEEER